MSSSDEDNRYQPVLAEKIRGAANSPQPHSPSMKWPKDGVNVYGNELYRDGDVLGEPEPALGGSHRHMSAFEDAPPSPSRPMSANRVPGQGSLAARRQRMIATGIERNDPRTGSLRVSNAAPSSPGGSMRRGSSNESPQRQAPGPDDGYASSRSESAAINTLPSHYDPNPEQEEEEERPSPHSSAPNAYSTVPSHRSNLGPAPQRQPPPPVELDPDDMITFLMRPGPKHGPIQCYIVREKSGTKMYPKYNLFLEDGQTFLLAARKRKKATTSNYVMSLDGDDLARESDKFLGKLRANFVGTEFTVYDSGDKGGAGGGRNNSGGHPVDHDADGAGSVRHELACVTYQYNVLGTRGPRKMTGVIPKLDSGGLSCYKPASEEDTLLDRVKNHRALSDLMVMHNKPPRWNEELNAYCLNFSGRVTEASVKNFQLITDDNQNHVILQFGKVGKHKFTMDYQWPINALQAFGICLSSFDNKLACE